MTHQRLDVRPAALLLGILPAAPPVLPGSSRSRWQAAIARAQAESYQARAALAGAGSGPPPGRAPSARGCCPSCR